MITPPPPPILFFYYNIFFLASIWHFNFNNKKTCIITWIYTLKTIYNNLNDFNNRALWNVLFFSPQIQTHLFMYLFWLFNTSLSSKTLVIN